jgi:acyl carrier protein phosphodiesterase
MKLLKEGNDPGSLFAFKSEIQGSLLFIYIHHRNQLSNSNHLMHPFRVDTHIDKLLVSLPSMRSSRERFNLKTATRDCDALGEIRAARRP